MQVLAAFSYTTHFFWKYETIWWHTAVKRFCQSFSCVNLPEEYVAKSFNWPTSSWPCHIRSAPVTKIVEGLTWKLKKYEDDGTWWLCSLFRKTTRVCSTAKEPVAPWFRLQQWHGVKLVPERPLLKLSRKNRVQVKREHFRNFRWLALKSLNPSGSGCEVALNGCFWFKTGAGEATVPKIRLFLQQVGGVAKRQNGQSFHHCQVKWWQVLARWIKPRLLKPKPRATPSFRWANSCTTQQLWVFFVFFIVLMFFWHFLLHS